MDKNPHRKGFPEKSQFISKGNIKRSTKIFSCSPRPKQPTTRKNLCFFKYGGIKSYLLAKPMKFFFLSYDGTTLVPQFISPYVVSPLQLFFLFFFFHRSPYMLHNSKHLGGLILVFHLCKFLYSKF